MDGGPIRSEDISFQDNCSLYQQRKYLKSKPVLTNPMIIVRNADMSLFYKRDRKMQKGTGIADDKFIVACWWIY